MCLGGCSPGNCHILYGKAQNHRAGQGEAGTWSRGQARSWGRSAASPSSLRQRFSAGLGLLRNHSFQREFSLSQPKCISQKTSQDSSGTQKQSSSWLKPPSLPAAEQQKGSGLVSVPGAFCHLNTFLWLLPPHNSGDDKPSDTGHKGSKTRTFAPEEEDNRENQHLL